MGSSSSYHHHYQSTGNINNNNNNNNNSLLDGLHFHLNISDADNLLDDFEDSHPSSSDDDSDDSSLDDVCLPINTNSSSTLRNWPDLSVLEDFYEEEMRETRAIAEANKQNIPFSDGYSTADENSHDPNQAVGFHFPLVSKIDTPAPTATAGSPSPPLPHTPQVPTLLTRKINETEAIQGRLRPPRFSPWDKSVRQNLQKYLPNEIAGGPLANHHGASFPPHGKGGANTNASAAALGHGPIAPHHPHEKKFQQFRYTYFRPTLDATIHSPSISGLLQDNQTFADLFVVSQQQKAKVPASIIKQKSRLNIPDSAATASNASSNPKDGTATPRSFTGTGTSNGIGSGSGGTNASGTVNGSLPLVPDEPVPFWLDVLDPTEEEMKVLSKAFGIHPLTTEDIFLNEAREKVELFKDYYFVCFRSFDIVQEKLKRKKLNEKLSNLENIDFDELKKNSSKLGNLKNIISKIFTQRRRGSHDGGGGGGYASLDSASSTTTAGNNDHLAREIIQRKKRQGAKVRRQSNRYRELQPLNFYIIVFHEGVLTFHFSPTPHPVTVRRRARLLKDYLTVSSDWIAYALIDDITDAFGPMIETIEDEVYSFEDAILKLHSGNNSDSDSELDSDSDGGGAAADAKTIGTTASRNSSRSGSSSMTSSSSSSTSSTSSSSYYSNSSAEWQRKGDMLRRIGECRKRIMSLLRLLGSKADVIKGLSKRCNENFDVAPRSEIGMYLGDIQDHIITMVQSLNHYEKLLARSHSNYLAQINIDMTKVNNDMNDVLGKITVLGTIVLPMNVITGLWGMNVLVPGQDAEGLAWFFSILVSMLLIAIASYFITVKVYNF